MVLRYADTATFRSSPMCGRWGHLVVRQSLWLVFGVSLCCAGCSLVKPNDQEMFAAVASGDIVGLQHLLDRGGDPAARLGAKESTLLHTAAARGEVEIAASLLGAGADINARNVDGQTPLQAAVMAERAEMVRFLAENGADLDTRGWHGLTALHIAASWGIEGMSQLLLDLGANSNARDAQGRTPLVLSRSEGRLPRGEDAGEVVRALTEAGGYDSSLYEGMSAVGALFDACRLNDLSKIQELMDLGTDPNAVLGGQTREHRYGPLMEALEYYGLARSSPRPLHFAAAKGLTKIAKALLDAGADVNAAAEYDRTPLHCAIRHGRTDMVRLLLEREADPNAEDNGPLMEALALSDEDSSLTIARLLIKAGADVNAKPEYGLSPVEAAASRDDLLDLLLASGAKMTLRVAIEAGRAKEALEMIRSGASLNEKISCDSELYTMLDWSMAHDQEPVADELRRRGVRMSMWNAIFTGDVAEVRRYLREGESANGFAFETSYLAIAAAKNEVRCAEILLDHGARINEIDMDGNTALDLAVAEGHSEMVRFLRSRGGKRGSAADRR